MRLLTDKPYSFVIREGIIVSATMHGITIRAKGRHRSTAFTVTWEQILALEGDGTNLICRATEEVVGFKKMQEMQADYERRHAATGCIEKPGREISRESYIADG